MHQERGEIIADCLDFSQEEIQIKSPVGVREKAGGGVRRRTTKGEGKRGPNLCHACQTTPTKAEKQKRWLGEEGFCGEGGGPGPQTKVLLFRVEKNHLQSQGHKIR